MEQYIKKPITIQEQILSLKNRGLQFYDEKLAEEYMLSVGYFRLDSYFHPFLNSPTNRFLPNTTFESIVYHYRFDCELRSIIFSAIQDVEIAIRTRMVHFFSLSNGPFWYAERKNFKNRLFFSIIWPQSQMKLIVLKKILYWNILKIMRSQIFLLRGKLLKLLQ